MTIRNNSPAPLSVPIQCSHNNFTTEDPLRKKTDSIYRKTNTNQSEFSEYNADNEMATLDKNSVLRQRSILTTSRKNKTFSNAKVNRPRFSLLFVRENLKDDEDFVLKVLALTPIAQEPMKLVSDRLKNDKDFITKAIAIHRSWVLQWASERLRDDQDVVKKAIEISSRFWGDPDPLQLASQRLRDDKDFVIHAIKNTCREKSSLCWASDRLKNDFELIQTALSYNSNALDAISLHKKIRFQLHKPIHHLTNLTTNIYFCVSKIFQP